MPMIRRPGATPGSPQSSGPVGEEGAPTGGVSGPSLHVPSDTTPTWELEMLVSGAVLVGLVQVAPLIDHAWLTLVPRLGTRTASMEAGLAYALLKGALYALLATFVVHLLSRAYWVALVGLDSVFPRGIRWETVRESRGLTAEEIADRSTNVKRAQHAQTVSRRDMDDVDPPHHFRQHVPMILSYPFRFARGTGGIHQITQTVRRNMKVGIVTREI